jgi:hypothetical protein
MKNITYDSNVNQEFATNMYLQAARIIRSETIKYAFLGLIIFLALGAFLSTKFNSGSTSTLIVGVIGLLGGGYYGYQQGLLKSFELKLEAQRALCFVEIEKKINN